VKYGQTEVFSGLFLAGALLTFGGLFERVLARGLKLQHGDGRSKVFVSRIPYLAQGIVSHINALLIPNVGQYFKNDCVRGRVERDLRQLLTECLREEGLGAFVGLGKYKD
jgi:hypothetical protein